MSKTNTKMIAACVACLSLGIPTAFADTSTSFTLDNTSFQHLRSTSTNFQLNGGLNRIEELASSSFLIVPETEETSSSSASSTAASSGGGGGGEVSGGGGRRERPHSSSSSSSARSSSSAAHHASTSSAGTTSQSSSQSQKPEQPPGQKPQESGRPIDTSAYTVFDGSRSIDLLSSMMGWEWIDLHSAAPPQRIIGRTTFSTIIVLPLIFLMAITLAITYWIATFEKFLWMLQDTQRYRRYFFGLIWERKRDDEDTKRAKKSRPKRRGRP
jgi:hypothetical protein